MQVQSIKSVPQTESGNYKTTSASDADLFNEMMGRMQGKEQPAIKVDEIIGEGHPTGEDDEMLQSQLMAEQLMILHPMQYVTTMLSIEEQQIDLEANSPLTIELIANEQPETEMFNSQDTSMPVDNLSREISEPSENNQAIVETDSRFEAKSSQPSSSTQIETKSTHDEKTFHEQVEVNQVNPEDVINSLENLEQSNVSEFSQNISQIVSEVQNEVMVHEASSSVDFSKWENQSEVMSAMENQLLLIRENDTTKLNLKLYPQHLGAISVELNMKNGVVQANVLLDNIEAKPLIEQAFADLNLDGTAFEALNVQINNQSKEQRKESEEGLDYDYSDFQVEKEEILQPKAMQINTGILNLKI